MEQRRAMLPHGPAALNELADAAPLPDLRTLLLATRRFGSKPKRLICQTSAPHPSPDGMNGALRCQDLPGAPSVPMVGADSRRPLREWAAGEGTYRPRTRWGFLSTAVTGALDVHTAGSGEIKPFWEVATPYPLYTENVLLLFESTFVLPLDYKHGDCSIRRHHGA